MSLNDIVSQTLADLGRHQSAPPYDLELEEAGRYCRCTGCAALQQRIDDLERSQQDLGMHRYEDHKTIKRLKGLLKQKTLLEKTQTNRRNQ
ncbi:MAG: hypothetical protein RIM72_00380 [Alphaproteobacteria bacterium]